MNSKNKPNRSDSCSCLHVPTFRYHSQKCMPETDNLQHPCLRESGWSMNFVLHDLQTYKGEWL